MICSRGSSLNEPILCGEIIVGMHVVDAVCGILRLRTSNLAVSD